MKKEMLLKDPTLKPTKHKISDCLGTAYVAYDKFINELKTYDIVCMEWRFYNDGKAWLTKGEYTWITSRGTKKVKPIFWVSIWNGFFKVSFNFSENTRDALLELPICEDTKERVRNVVSNGDKKKYIAVIFDVDNEKQLKDIYLLSEFRKKHI